MVDSADSLELPSEAFRSILMEFIEQRLKTKQFEMNINLAAKNGDNFVGIVQRVFYSKKSSVASHSNENSSVIYKMAPTNDARREQFFSRTFFLREIHAYNEVKIDSIVSQVKILRESEKNQHIFQ